MELEVPDSWDELRDRLRSENAVAMLVGGAHVGKSTLARWLCNGLVVTGRRIVLVDADVGQSNVGPPGTLGLVPIRKPIESWLEVTPTALFFVGALSPAGLETACVNGLSKLLKLARRQTGHTILVNTSGYVDSAFMGSSIAAVDPSILVLLAQGDELDELKASRPASGRRIMAMKPATAAVAKSDSVRQSNREAAFQRYFQQGQVWPVLPVHVRVQSLRGGDAPWLPNFLVGLLDGAGVCLGVGVSLPPSREGHYRYFAPVHSGVQRILMGSYQVPADLLKTWMARVS